MENARVQRPDGCPLRALVHRASRARCFSSAFINLDEVRPGKSRQASSKKLQEPKVIREVSSAEPVDLSGSLLPGKREDYKQQPPPNGVFYKTALIARIKYAPLSAP